MGVSTLSAFTLNTATGVLTPLGTSRSVTSVNPTAVAGELESLERMGVP